MSVLSSIGAFINRHRRKLFISAGIVASGYFAIDYLKNKFFEIQDRLATERSAKEKYVIIDMNRHVGIIILYIHSLLTFFSSSFITV